MSFMQEKAPVEHWPELPRGYVIFVTTCRHCEAVEVVSKPIRQPDEDDWISFWPCSGCNVAMQVTVKTLRDTLRAELLTHQEAREQEREQLPYRPKLPKTIG